LAATLVVVVVTALVAVVVAVVVAAAIVAVVVATIVVATAVVLEISLLWHPALSCLAVLRLPLVAIARPVPRPVRACAAAVAQAPLRCCWGGPPVRCGCP